MAKTTKKTKPLERLSGVNVPDYGIGVWGKPHMIGGTIIENVPPILFRTFKSNLMLN